MPALWEVPSAAGAPIEACPPGNVFPRLLQPVDGVALQGGEDGIQRREVLEDPALPGHLDPVLHHPGPVWGFRASVPEAGGDDTVGHAVELGDSGADGGCQVLLALLVPLGPDGAQAVVGHHLLEQLRIHQCKLLCHQVGREHQEVRLLTQPVLCNHR